MKNVVLAIAMGVFFIKNAVASCCSSTASGGIPRLLPHERALVELAYTTRMHYASFNKTGDLSFGYQKTSPYLFIDEDLLLMARIIDYVQPFIRFPVRMQKNDQGLNAGLGDIAFGARLPLLPENFIKHAPSLTLQETIRAPTGASLKADSSLPTMDIFGTGSWQFLSGIVLEKTMLPITFGVAYSLGFLPEHVMKAPKVAGLIHTPAASCSMMTNESGIVNLSLSYSLWGQTRINDVALVHSDKRKLTLALAYSHTLHSHLKLQTGLGFDPPFPYINKNNNSEWFARVGMRIGVF